MRPYGVVRIKFSGKIIASYASLIDASERCGVSVSYVFGRCNHRVVNEFDADGCTFRYEHDADDPFPAKDRNRRGVKRGVIKLDRNGRVAEWYESLDAAAKANNLSYNTIFRRCRGLTHPMHERIDDCVFRYAE